MSKSPFLHAVEQVLSAAGTIQGVTQVMPGSVQEALRELGEQYAKLSNFQKIAYSSEEELNRLDWNVVKSALRQASKDVMSARGMQQEPSWLQPAIQIAEERSRPPVQAAESYRVAFSAAQMAERDGAGFWNVTHGWVRLEDASYLTESLNESAFLSAMRNGGDFGDVKLIAAPQAEELEEDYLERTEGFAVGRPC